MSTENSSPKRRLFPCGQSRREFVWEMGAGFAGAALTSLLGADGFFGRHARAERIGRGWTTGPLSGSISPRR